MFVETGTEGTALTSAKLLVLALHHPKKLLRILPCWPPLVLPIESLWEKADTDKEIEYCFRVDLPSETESCNKKVGPEETLPLRLCAVHPLHLLKAVKIVR
jgi:hypothetical protein